MGDGQETLSDFPKRFKEIHIAINPCSCWGCGAIIDDAIQGDDGWLFCLCGMGIMKVTL